MFKKKAFLISLALLASNFLLPNQVRSGPEGEEFISETQEFNFRIKKVALFIRDKYSLTLILAKVVTFVLEERLQNLKVTASLESIDCKNFTYYLLFKNY